MKSQLSVCRFCVEGVRIRTVPPIQPLDFSVISATLLSNEQMLQFLESHKTLKDREEESVRRHRFTGLYGNAAENEAPKKSSLLKHH